MHSESSQFPVHVTPRLKQLRPGIPPSLSFTAVVILEDMTASEIEQPGPQSSEDPIRLNVSKLSMFIVGEPFVTPVGEKNLSPIPGQITFEAQISQREK